MDEDLKRLIEGSAEETRRQFGTVVESLRSDIKAVADGVAGNTARIDRLSADMKQEFRCPLDDQVLSFRA